MSPGKILIVLGAALIFIGLAVQFGGKLPIGRLPGDIVIERENFRLYIPITTSLLVSVLITLMIYLIGRLRH